MTDCSCSRPTRDNATTCDTCLDSLARALGDCPWIAEETQLTLTGARGVDYRALGGSRAAEVPLPLHLGASTARANLTAVLTKWVRYCYISHVPNQSPIEAMPPATVEAMSGWLLWRVDGLGFREEGSSAVEEITAAVEKCLAIIDRPADKWFAGPCDDCGADLYAKSKTGQVTCRVCKAGYDIAERRAWLLAAAEDRLAKASEVARAVSWLGASPLTADRVRQWAVRGRILAKGHDGIRPLYRIGDAIDLLAADTTKAG